MKLLWKKTTNPEPPIEPTAPPAPAPEPEPVVVEDQAPEQAPPAAAVTETGVDFTRIIASVVTAASAVFTVWSVWDLARHGAEEGQAAPHLVGLGAGIGVEAVWLWLLAIEWQQATRTGRVNPVLTRTGWALAGGACVVLVVHGVLTSWPMALLAVLPLAAKAGWHWLTALRCEQTRARLEAEAAVARAAAETERQAEEETRRQEEEVKRREQMLSTGLTPEQEEELAQIRRQASYARAKAEAESELTTAQAEADRERQQADADSERIRQETESQMRQEAVQRRVREQMAMQQANVDLLKQRNELEMELRLTRPYALGSAEEAHSSRVPDDPSGFGLPPVSGFGFAQPQSREGEAPRSDLGVPPGASPSAPGGAPRPEEALTGPQRLLVYVDDAGAQATVKGAARQMGVHPRTIRRYRETLAEAGHDVSALGADPADS